MTNRRTFLRDIALGLSAAIFAPAIINPTFHDTLRFNRPKIWILNPEYTAATYELGVWRDEFQTIKNGKKFIGHLFIPNTPVRISSFWDDPESELQSHIKAHDPEYDPLDIVRDPTWVSAPIHIRLRLDKTYIPPFIMV